MRRQQSGTTPVCISEPSDISWHGGPLALPAARDCSTRRRRCRMPLRQTIGISLALSDGLRRRDGQSPGKNRLVPPQPAPRRRPPGIGNRTDKSRVRRGRPRPDRHRGWPVSPSADPLSACGLVSARDRDADPRDLYWGATHTAGSPEIGQAAWYDLVGGRTSSGERLDTVTPTAAHRSLPLGSCAKVTDPRHRTLGDRQNQ